MSKPRSYRPPDPLEPALDKRLEELGMSWAEYVTSLTSFDLSTAKPHTFTGDFHRLPARERDLIYAEIARAYLSGEAQGGRWADARISEAVKDAALTETPPESTLAKKFRERLLKRNKTQKPDNNGDQKE